MFFAVDIMELSKGLQEEIILVQNKLKNAIRDHQVSFWLNNFVIFWGFFYYVCFEFWGDLGFEVFWFCGIRRELVVQLQISCDVVYKGIIYVMSVLVWYDITITSGFFFIDGAYSI